MSRRIYPVAPERWRQLAFGVGLALCSVGLLTLAFPPYNLGWLIWVGFIPMLVAQYRVLPSRFSSLAPAIALGGWLGTLLIPAFGGKSLFMAAIPLGVGALVLVMDKTKRGFHERTGYRWFVVEGVTGWVGLEMIRSFIPAIGTWAFVGYPLWNQPWLLQPLSLVGIYGLDVLIMLVNYALAQTAIAWFDRHWTPEVVCGPTPRAVRRWLVVTAFGLILWVAISLGVWFAEPTDLPTVRVAAIQPNLPRAAHRDLVTLPETRLDVLAAQTRDAAAQGAQVIVWPEMALGFDPQVEYTNLLRALASETRAYLVIGYVLDDELGFRNAATILSPSGEFLGAYAKNHPMIASGEPRSVGAGLYPVYDTPVGRLATLICFDASFTDVARRLGKQDAQLLANPSLFGPSIAALTTTQVVFRAVENRVPVVMADVAYNSAIVDAYGRILELVITPEGAQTTLVADVPLGQGRTLYARVGDVLGWFSLVGFIFFALGRKTLEQATRR